MKRGRSEFTVYNSLLAFIPVLVEAIKEEDVTAYILFTIWLHASVTALQTSCRQSVLCIMFDVVWPGNICLDRKRKWCHCANFLWFLMSVFLFDWHLHIVFNCWGCFTDVSSWFYFIFWRSNWNSESREVEWNHASVFHQISEVHSRTSIDDLTAFLWYLSQAWVLGLIFLAVLCTDFNLFTDHTPNCMKDSVKKKNLKWHLLIN